MKCPDYYKTIGAAAVSSALVFTAIILWLLAKPATSHCLGEVLFDSNTYKAHPAKVVVRPWFGPHQVFGIFVVPLRYRSGKSYSGTISVQGIKDEFVPDWQPKVRQVEDVVVEPEYYLVRGYVPTRTALWFLFTGQLGDLRSPCNWTIEISERSK